MTDNYIDVKHEYFGLPNHDGHRLRTVDVWYAVRPSSPQFTVVDYEDTDLPGSKVDLETAWTVHKAGLDQIIIVDRDDINGLRRLLDEIEHGMDRRDMEALHASLEEVDNDDESE